MHKGAIFASFDFVINFFAVLTAFSAFPFDLGNHGEFVVGIRRRRRNKASAKLGKSLELKGGSLSEHTVSGQPCIEKCAFSFRRTLYGGKGVIDGICSAN